MFLISQAVFHEIFDQTLLVGWSWEPGNGKSAFEKFVWYTLPETNSYIAPKNGGVHAIGISKLPGGPYFPVRTVNVSFREGT